MSLNIRLLFGPMAAIILCAGIALTAMVVPGYSHVQQTVSEIGEVGSPAQLPFTLVLCVVAVCLLVFAWAVRDALREAGRLGYSALILAAMAVSVAGVGVFAFPDPLHNLFGISELIGYQAPLVLALAHRKVAGAGVIIAFSLVMYVLVVAALVLNLASLDRSGDLWLAVKDVYGLAQRALFAAWFAWCAGVGLLMIRRRRSPPAAT